MSTSTTLQIIGNACVALAAVVFLWPLQRMLSKYAPLYLSDDRWALPALHSLVPLWLLLMVALLCVAASGGFDWLRLGRPVLYGLCVVAAFALAAATFVFIGLYIRPGMAPGALFFPFVCMVPWATMLLVVLSLNPGLTSGSAPGWLRVPWAVFAALSLIGCVVFAGHWLVRDGVAGMAISILRAAQLGGSSQEELAKIAAMDPERDFESLLRRANRDAPTDAREAATARLRSHPRFLERLANELESGPVEPAVAFVRDAQLSVNELNRLALPSLRAMDRWVYGIPAPNYTTAKHLRELRRWGTETLRVLKEKLAGTGADFAPLMEEFEDKLQAGK